jgi:biopolymer transport protein ExbB
MRWLLVALGACSFRHGVTSGGAQTGDASPDMSLAAWHHRRAVMIDTSSLTADLGAFPVLVTLNKTTFDYSLARADGADLKFTLGDGTPLAFDLDTWAPTDTSWLWVSVPLAKPPAPAPTVWLYYGNPDATSAADPAATWTGYTSVHHLTDFSDASGGGHDGVPASTATTPAIANGKIGGARTFDGVMTAIPLPASPAYDFTTAMSMSAWVRVASFDVAWQCIVCKGDSSWRMHRGNTTNHADFGTTPVTGTSGNDNIDSTSNIDGGAWHHVVVSYDGTNKHVYVDGMLQGSKAIGPLNTTTYVVILGENAEAAPPRYFHGDLDEVRIAGDPRTPAWFAAEYRTVTDPSFVHLGADEVIP